MDKGAVRRIHQTDNRVVDRRGKADALDEVGWASLEPFDKGDFRGCGGVVAEKQPEVPLHFAYRVAAHSDAVGGEGLTRHQRRDCRTMTAGIEAPAVIAALDLIPVE